MNRLTQLFFLVLFPFLPIWAWVLQLVHPSQIETFITVVLIPIALYIIISPKINFPKYLTFFVFFTIYHLVSVYINGLIPPDITTFKFLLSNRNILACLLFFVAENTHFDERFIRIMNRNIFLIVIISLICMLISQEISAHCLKWYLINTIY